LIGRLRCIYDPRVIAGAYFEAVEKQGRDRETWRKSVDQLLHLT
jgi:hypothetical protein